MSAAAAEALQSVTAEWRPHVWCRSSISYPVNPHLSIENITEILLRSASVLSKIPFIWSLIDRPVEGSSFLVYLQPGTDVPSDGLLFMDRERMHQIQLPGKVLECHESRLGFFPFAENSTSRVRRRFRISAKYGGNDFLWLVHYLRASDNDRVPVNIAQATPQPPRPYPMPPVSTRPFSLQAVRTANERLDQAQVQAQVQRQQQQPHATPDNIQGDRFDLISPRDVSLSRFSRYSSWMRQILDDAYRPVDITKDQLSLVTIDSLEKIKKSLSEQVEELQSAPAPTRTGNDISDSSAGTSTSVIASLEAVCQLIDSVQTSEQLETLLKDNNIAGHFAPLSEARKV